MEAVKCKSQDNVAQDKILETNEFALQHC